MALIQIGQYAGAAIAVLSLFGLVIKYAIVMPIKTYIDHATYQIQPFSNGGFSLADANQSLNRIESKVCEMDERLIQVENLVTKPATRNRKQPN
jgi:xanthosine utilization system XapX-like protein